jgi:diguanylate cyclase (GGDEF)-like protein/PAS domain S-box-containing protein
MLVAAGEILGAGVDRQESDPAAEPPQTLSPEQDAAIARMVFNALDAGVLVQGPRGRIATANPAAARILGVELDDILGSDSGDLAGPLLHPDGTPMTADELPSRLAVRTGRPQLDVLVGLPSDEGDQRWIEVSARPLTHRGQVFAVVSSLRDVTERKRAEEALRNAERRQRIVLEHAVGGYAIFDDAGKLLDGSSSLVSWWDGRLAEKRSIGIDRMHPDDRNAAWRIIEQAKSSPGEPKRSELRVIEDDGQVRWIEFTATDQRADPAVGGIVVNFTDITERKQAGEALAHQALHDPVTGLPNRRLLADRLQLALARADRNGTRVGVLFFDVDHFKLVNDSLGHPAGDRVLQELAGRFRAGARESDTVVRFGGDEFVIVCEDLTEISEAREVADRLTARVEEPFPIDEGERIVTVSAGVAISRSGDTPSSLLSDADAAMNVAKERGRARVETFNEEMRSQATRRFDLDTALRRALERGELHLVFQPVMTVDGGRPVGCEALLRWDHPDLGAVSPAEFVPLAERSGLIVPIGAWVVGRALEQLADWDRERPEAPGLWVAINLSGRQLGAPDLVAVVTDALERTGIDPERLHLEVTESALIDDLATSIDRLGELKQLGVHIDVDDFGTGYSSLSYLKRLPLDTLKIDGSFVGGLGTDPHDTSIVRAIISLGHALDLDLIAEGVETETQLVELARLGCDLAQGFHWSRPLPPEEFIGRFGHV